MGTTETHEQRTSGGRSWALALVGVLGLAAAALGSPSKAQSAASQDWPPFVLVAGLLLIGLVANDDGLFAAAGHQLARVAHGGVALFAGATLVISVVTAVLNLDTSVAFLTPVFVYTARRRGNGEAPLLYGCLLLSNAASLFLPGSNLTNLIILGHLHLSGGSFAARMWAPAITAVLVTASLVGGLEHRALRVGTADLPRPDRPVVGLGLVAVIAAALLVIVFRSPALMVGAVGTAVIVVRIAWGRSTLRSAMDALGAPVLVGLFGIAVALGTLGRVWSGPAGLLAHLDVVETAVVAAAGSVLVNNLPAASLFAAHVPPHPYALLVGLNLGPNLAVTGSLAWLLWIRSARLAGARPSLAKASRMGLLAVPPSIAATLAVLISTSPR